MITDGLSTSDVLTAHLDLPRSVSPVATSLLSKSAVTAVTASPSESLHIAVHCSMHSNKVTFTTTRYIDEAFWASTFFTQPAGHDAALAYMVELFTCTDIGLINVDNHYVYSSKTPKMEADMPTFQ